MNGKPCPTQVDLFADHQRPPTATYSPCWSYRYTLTRTWDARLPILGSCGLNPSTATEYVDDPTIAKETRLAKRLGYGGLLKINLYGLRSTDPAGLWEVAEPVGPDNYASIAKAVRTARVVLCGWGKLDKGPDMPARAARVVELLQAVGVKLLCLQLNKDGSPTHPLYLPDALDPVPFTPGGT